MLYLFILVTSGSVVCNLSVQNVNVSVFAFHTSAGEHSADNAWDFKELEEAITKTYL